MNKIDSPSSNNSRTSSETSETQSVEEVNLTNELKSPTTPQTGNVSSTRSLKKPKRMKDANNDKEAKERPPWRAVSLSTLPKPDKNALLKAKLLDASRRMRAGKVSIALQTDIEPTKLMKEVNLGTQVDLILHREMGVMTDGSYMKKKQGSDEFVLTYAVTTLTDAIQYADGSTQTLLPKLPEDDFMKAYLECDLRAIDSKDFTEVQKQLLQQICKIKEVARSKERDSDCGKEIDEQSQLRQYPFTGSFSRAPTLQSWHFELDEIGQTGPYFQPYTISPNRPWKSFVPLNFYGFYNNYLGGGNGGRLDWNILFQAIDDLIRESNNLVDIIEDLTKAKVETQEVPNLVHRPRKLPSEYWLPIIEQQEKELEAILQEMKSKNNKNE